MIRRPVPKKPAPKLAAPTTTLPTAEEIANIQIAEAHYKTGQTFLTDAEILELARTIEARHAADRAADASKFKAAYPD